MATKILTTGIRLEPNNHELYFERSICHHKLGDYQASLDDASAAIRLNSNDYNIHYQKGLALIGLSMFSDAVISFKKAIELRAKQDDSKLSDIFKLLRDAINELNTARRRPGSSNHQARNESAPSNQSGTIVAPDQRTSSDPVDSTTDRPSVQPGASSNNQTLPPVGSYTKNGNNTLVATNRNIQPAVNSNPVLNGTVGTNRVSSSASHMSNHLATSINVSPDISSINVGNRNTGADLMGNSADQQFDQTKPGSFEWNIRRSERIFLHHSNEPGTSGPQYGILTRQTDSPGTVMHQQQKTSSNPSSVTSVRGATKRLHDNFEPITYQQNKAARSKGTNSHLESEIDVDDSHNSAPTTMAVDSDLSDNRKRVMIAPSSSMPATNLGPSTSNSKDDSYSSKYKRLRRDRERARRGTSKLCTIKLSDLEEMQRSGSNEKRFMRVIAPIDGWLYSGQLAVDTSNTNSDTTPQYVVKLDGDATGSSYLFSQDTVLNDVIKEVRVKTVSELRKGARICCYWSRQYKCLSTGVVTSRTFEATKSLVSVKYDNGDLSALPLEDLRLLPPDYPKYMSNCDPLLLTRNGDGTHMGPTAPNVVAQNGNRVVVELKPAPTSDAGKIESITTQSIDKSNLNKVEINLAEKSKATLENTKSLQEFEPSQHDYSREENQEDYDEVGENDEDDEDATIPPTDETIDFITSESTLKQQDGNQHDVSDCVERVSNTKDSITITNETQHNSNASRASSEENNYGIEYCPWMFDGPPRRSKRHGRTYRDTYLSIRRGNEVIKVGDSAELMPRDESILPFIAKIDGLWATGRGEMRVRVRWYYRLVETEGEPFELKDGENALFETDHFDENDVQSIYRSTQIMSWTDYSTNNLGHVNTNNHNAPKIFYLAGYYDPVRRVKHLRSDVKEAQ